MLPRKLAFVDLETTGVRSRYDRIIEIGIVLVDDDTVTSTYSSLINPGSHIPPSIQEMTGITQKELETAPSFRDIHDTIQELLVDRVFVAHNARFDYGFLKSEFKRLEKSFSPKQFCTVRFSRTLFPTLPRHNLDTIIAHFDIHVANRHRALDDAQATYEFFRKAREKTDPDIFLQAVEKTLKKPYLPKNLDAHMLDALPESPGVYIFYGDDTFPLYIGKSINIKDRVLSHFSDILSPTEMNISQQITRIETVKTAGELGALFLESKMIKEHLPLYNKMLRQTQELFILKKNENEDGYFTTSLEQLSRSEPPDIQTNLGIYRTRRQAKESQSALTLKYSLCEKLLGLEKTNGACFGYRLERCRGACIGKESPLSYNMRFVEAFSTLKIKNWPYNGKIIITETDDIEGKTDYFLIDNWCLLNKVQTDTNDSFLEDEYEYSFDLDTYKIICRYILSTKNVHKIKTLLNDN